MPEQGPGQERGSEERKEVEPRVVDRFKDAAYEILRYDPEVRVVDKHRSVRFMSSDGIHEIEVESFPREDGTTSYWVQQTRAEIMVGKQAHELATAYFDDPKGKIHRRFRDDVITSDSDSKVTSSDIEAPGREMLPNGLESDEAAAFRDITKQITNDNTVFDQTEFNQLLDELESKSGLLIDLTKAV